VIPTRPKSETRLRHAETRGSLHAILPPRHEAGELNLGMFGECRHAEVYARYRRRLRQVASALGVLGVVPSADRLSRACQAGGRLTRGMPTPRRCAPHTGVGTRSLRTKVARAQIRRQRESLRRRAHWSGKILTCAGRHGSTRAWLDLDTEDRFVALRRQPGVTSFGINEIVR
jgi:hypothetical protein